MKCWLCIEVACWTRFDPVNMHLELFCLKHICVHWQGAEISIGCMVCQVMLCYTMLAAISTEEAVKFSCLPGSLL